MRLGAVGSERPYLLVGPDRVVDVSDVVTDFDGDAWRQERLSALREVESVAGRSGAGEPIGARRVGAPITRPHQIICIGLNYADHAAETGQAIPAEPIVFTKAPNTLVGPHDDVWIPRGSTRTDWEVELGLVIGERCRYLESDDAARSAIAGYVVVNDVSEREFQLERGGQWTKGKSAETFNPCGPVLATPDELDPGNLDLWLTVNGATRQSGSTSTMIFSPTQVVRYLSQFMVLEPGDLINTGTPPGVGMGMQPPQYLNPGDVVELGVSGLGSQRQNVLAAP